MVKQRWKREIERSSELGETKTERKRVLKEEREREKREREKERETVNTRKFFAVSLSSL